MCLSIYFFSFVLFNFLDADLFIYKFFFISMCFIIRSFWMRMCVLIINYPSFSLSLILFVTNKLDYSKRFIIQYICLTFRVYIHFHFNSVEIWEMNKEGRVKEFSLKDLHFNIIVVTIWHGTQEVFWGFWETKFEFLFLFRLHYTLQHGMGILSVCAHF